MENAIQDIRFYSWSELLVALKKFQDIVSVSTSSSRLINECLDCLVGRISLVTETSPCASTSSPESSLLRLSSDTRSTASSKSTSFKSTWWFEDLASLNPNLIQILINTMVTRKFHHGFISKFLFYYHKSRFITATPAEKLDLTEKVVGMLHFLDHPSVSCKRLFGILRVALNLKVSKCCRSKLEEMIGSQLDKANLDDLLVLSSIKANHLYDVNLVLRLINSFLVGGMEFDTLIRSKKVSCLIDLYIAEVAPDPYLKPKMFLNLVMALPDSARDWYDSIYHAMDMYIEVHTNLSEEEKTRLCSCLNYEKLSLETCKQLTVNSKFPTKLTIQALASQQSKLKSLLLPEYRYGSKSNSEKDEQIVIYAENLEGSWEHDKLKAHLHGMQCRVLELEKVCRKMQTQMNKLMKSKSSSSQSNSRSVVSVPMFCS